MRTNPIRRVLPPTLLAALLAAALAAVLLAFTGVAEARAPAHPPKVGDCHDYQLATVAKIHDTSPKVNCNQDHTTRVIAVAHLRKNETWATTTTKEVVSRATHVCYPKFWKALGRTHAVRDRTAYSFFFYTPTRAQKQDGARWIRCDIGLYGGSKLLNLPTDAIPALPANGLPDSVKRCLKARTFATTTCGRRHAWRGTGAFSMHVSKFPSAQRAERLAWNHCPQRTSSRDWRYSYRSRTAFQLGDKVMVCYSRTHH